MSHVEYVRRENTLLSRSLTGLQLADQGSGGAFVGNWMGKICGRYVIAEERAKVKFSNLCR